MRADDPRLVGGVDPRLVNGRDPRLVGGVDPRTFGAGRRGPRVRRGDVQDAVLALLIDGDMHGYQIITELTERSGGAWRPSPGSVYPTLNRLEKRGLITAQEQDGKRTYKLTTAGRRVAEQADGQPWQEFTEDPASVEFATATQSLFTALRQLEAVATATQLTKAAGILKSARKSIYLMLAEEES